MKPKVTIIVLVYNVEQYIEQSIQSAQKQTYSDIEILLVDDGSSDHSPQLCDAYAAADPRIRVIHQKNAGAMLARKTGLASATGKYVMFLDGDDWMDPDTVRICLESALENDADCVLFSYVREYLEESVANPLFPDGWPYDGKDTGKKVHERILGFRKEELVNPHRIDNLSSVCMKLYRTETARQGRFISEREVGTSEDTLFNLYALENCQKINYVDQCLYHYRKTNRDSITTRYKPELSEKWDRLYQYFEEYVRSSQEPDYYEQLFLNRVACGMIGLGLNEVSAGDSFRDKVSRIRKILRKPLYRKAMKQIDTKVCPLQWKFFYFLCKAHCAMPLTLLLQIMNKMRAKG